MKLAPVAGLSGQHLSAPVALVQVIESDDARRDSQQVLADQLAANCAAAELLSPDFYLTIVHHQVALAQPARGAEVEGAAIGSAIGVAIKVNSYVT